MLDLSRWPDADDLLDRALALQGAERETFLRDLAARDGDLGAALRAVLAEADPTDRFLEPGGALSGSVFSDLQRTLADDEPEALADGEQVGPYRVSGRIGRGGMGEVYRAHDSRLGREVAIKVLPHRFADDPQRRARFEREARMLASLAHPNIAAIHGLEHTPHGIALILELVDGTTLAERIASGPLPLPEALAVATGIADALEAAHERGVVHRDLKPANVKLGPGGVVKVLDFGLAKAVGGDAVGAPEVEIPDLTQAEGHPPGPMGTPAYMSPEQVRGRDVDHRTDIWAFGCVLYEMLTGTRAFPGATPTEIFARVLETPPDLSRLPGATPEPLTRVLRRCLEKDPKRRLGFIGDARLEIAEIREGADRIAASAGAGERSRWRPLGQAAAVFALGALVSLGVMAVLDESDPQPVSRTAIPVPEGYELGMGRTPTMALSPDGRMLVFLAERDGAAALFRRSLDAVTATAIRGTERGTTPFISPDSQWVGFEREGSLFKVPISGGVPTRIAAAQAGAFASWGSDGAIVFASGAGRVIQRVSASGGPVETITTLDEASGETAHGLPTIVPDAHAVPFTSWTGGAAKVGVLDLVTGERLLLTEGRQAHSIPTGHIVFARGNTLWAARFDPRARAITSEPVAFVQGVAVHSLSGNAMFALAASGDLAYVPEGPRETPKQLVWIDRTGREEPIAALGARGFSRFSLSPGGDRLAVSIAEAENHAVWVHSFEHGTLTRVTTDRVAEEAPIWSRDGRTIVFRSEREGGGLFRAAADGTGTVERLTSPGGGIPTPYVITPDGVSLVFSNFRSYLDQDIMMVGLNGDRRVSPLIAGPPAELRPDLSPDGRWLAYQSDASGRFEVYVAPFPGVATARWQVSTDGGSSPVWSPRGDELFYHANGAIMGVGFEAGTTFRSRRPEVIAKVPAVVDRLGPVFDVSPTARRFLMARDAEPEEPATPFIAFVENWMEEIAKKLP